MTFLEILTILMPILSILVLLVIFKISGRISMPIGFLLTSISSYLVWKMPLNAIMASAVEGTVLAISILWIMFGVIFTYHILQTKGINKTIKETIENLTTDKRAQLIIITIFFTSIIEGVAGFGTAAMLCIPILIALGFTPFSSVVFSVLGNAASINFGATGTPLIIGMTSGLKNGDTLYPQVATYFTEHNLDLNTFLHQVTMYSEGINLFAFTIFPLFLLLIYSKFFHEKKSFKYGLSFWKYSLITGFIFTVTVFLSQKYLGFEFPSIIAGILTTIVASYFAHKNWFMNERKHKAKKHKLSHKTILIAFSPYIALVVLLVITRLHSGLKTFLKGITFSLKDIFNTPISVNFEYAYSTGTMFLIIGIFSIIFMKINKKDTANIIKMTLHHMINPFIVLIFAVIMIRVFLNSYINPLNYPSEATQLALIIRETFGGLYPLVGGFVGALGAFLTGSCTFSAMMFSLIQFDTATSIGQNPANALGVQLTSGSIGNAISILNITAACGIAGISNQEGSVIRANIIPVVLYCLLLGGISYILYIL